MKDYSRVALYVQKYWPLLIRNSRNASRETRGLAPDDDIYLPYDFVVPGGVFDAMFYWDSFFIMVGLRHDPAFRPLIKSMTDNALYMVHHFGRVLNSNKKKWSSRSQLPYLSCMIRMTYDVYRDDRWLRNAMKTAEKEYANYWLGGNHAAPGGLSRFYEDSGDNYMTRHTEASWDMSPRYDDDDATDILPVDLNANLFLYEIRLAEFYADAGDSAAESRYREKAERRRALMRELMWSEEDGLFYDYDYARKRRKKIKSLAAYVPLWAGLCDDREAERLAGNLKLFEREFGLATCDGDYGYSDRQWNHPFGWAPLHWMVYQGLKAYGYEKDAVRIAKKWLDLNAELFDETFLLWEKYDVVHGEKADVYDRYPNQRGFGWTNGVFVDLYLDLKKNGVI